MLEIKSLKFFLSFQASAISFTAKWFLSVYVLKPLNLPSGFSARNILVASWSTWTSVSQPKGSHVSTSINICSAFLNNFKKKIFFSTIKKIF